MKTAMHRAYLLLGSNIRPLENMRAAYRLLGAAGEITACSRLWETIAVGSNGPNFLNATLCFQTPLSMDELKDTIIHPIENQLGRVRSADKNAPRTMDIDIILYDEQIVDENLWKRLHIAAPLAELTPDLQNPVTCQKLDEVAAALLREGWAQPRPETLC